MLLIYKDKYLYLSDRLLADSLRIYAYPGRKLRSMILSSTSCRSLILLFTVSDKIRFYRLTKNLIVQIGGYLLIMRGSKGGEISQGGGGCSNTSRVFIGKRAVELDFL